MHVFALICALNINSQPANLPPITQSWQEKVLIPEAKMESPITPVNKSIEFDTKFGVLFLGLIEKEEMVCWVDTRYAMDWEPKN
jgi:hypothetical protein